MALQACANRDYVVNLDTADVRAADGELYKQLVRYPREVMPILDEVARDVAVAEADEGDIDREAPPYIMVRHSGTWLEGSGCVGCAGPVFWAA